MNWIKENERNPDNMRDVFVYGNGTLDAGIGYYYEPSDSWRCYLDDEMIVTHWAEIEKPNEDDKA